MLPQGYKALYSLAGVEGNWIGASGDVGASTADVVLQLKITGSARCLVESSADGANWLDVSDGGYAEDTFVVCDHRQHYYRAKVQEYESGTITAVFGYGRGRENQIISIGRGPGEIEDEDVALGVSRTLAVLLGDSNTIASTASETAFNKSYTLPAGKANSSGATVRVTASGKMTTTGAPNFIVRLKLGGTTFERVDVTSVSATDKQWTAQGAFTARTTGSSATVSPGAGLAERMGGGVGTEAIIAAFSKDLSAALAITVTAEPSVSDPSNTITMTGLVVELLLPADTIA